MIISRFSRYFHVNISLLVVFYYINIIYTHANTYNGEDELKVLSSIQLGKFHINWDMNEPYLLIKNYYTNKILFRTLENWPFITAGYAASIRSENPIVDGNFKADTWTLYETFSQTIIKTELLKVPNRDHDNQTIPNEYTEVFVISGHVSGAVTLASYEMRFHIPSKTERKKSSSKLYILHALPNPYIVY